MRGEYGRRESVGVKWAGQRLNKHSIRQKGNKMRKRIADEFTDLPISRQRKYQMRMKRDGRCTECGEPAVQGSRCLKHLVKARERQRDKRGLKRRYKGTLSYRLQLAERKSRLAAARRRQAARARRAS